MTAIRDWFPFGMSSRHPPGSTRQHELTPSRLNGMQQDVPAHAPRTGIELSRVPVHGAEVSDPGVTIRGEVGDGGVGSADGGAHVPADAGVPTQGDAGTPAALSPFRVHFSMAQVAHPACAVPAGQSGAAKLAKYRVVGDSGPAAKVTVTEQFTPLEDPYGVAGQIRSATYVTGVSGEFDDCYMLATRQSLPFDFRLKVEQNHLVNGLVASKQHVTYSPIGVQLCVFNRQGGGFAPHCKRF